jgi:hypothetical protein
MSKHATLAQQRREPPGPLAAPDASFLDKSDRRVGDVGRSPRLYALPWPASPHLRARVLAGRADDQIMIDYSRLRGPDPRSTGGNDLGHCQMVQTYLPRSGWWNNCWTFGWYRSPLDKCPCVRLQARPAQLVVPTPAVEARLKLPDGTCATLLQTVATSSTRNSQLIKPSVFGTVSSNMKAAEAAAYCTVLQASATTHDFVRLLRTPAYRRACLLDDEQGHMQVQAQGGGHSIRPSMQSSNYSCSRVAWVTSHAASIAPCLTYKMGASPHLQARQF